MLQQPNALKNMKKHLFYISVTIFSIIALMQTANAATSTVDELLKEVKNQPKTAVAQNMYLEIYKEINDKPKESATKNTSEKYKMTEDQINKMVKEGDLSPLLKNQENATLDKITLQYAKISNDYNSSLETENLRTDLEMQTKPSEIFMDGDTSNSEFDVLYDLTIIEIILFNEASTSQFGGQFATPDFDFSDKEEEEFIKNLFGVNGEEDSLTQETGEEAASSTEFSPLSCLADESNLDKALSEFEASQTSNADGTGDESDGTIDYSAEEPEFPKAESDPWPTEYLCPEGSFYCIEISFDIKAAKAHGKSDNCIACHVQNINKELDKMLAKPLSANKLTGNLFEVPKCKSSYTSLPVNMNIITLAVAPPRQANQDKYIKLNIEKEWTKFQERFNAYFNSTSNPPPEQTVEDRSVKEALQASSAKVTIDELAVKTESRVQTTKTEVQQGVESQTKENRTELNNTKYQMTATELETMKKTFEAILKQFKDMKTPCTDLSIKAYCS